MHPIKHFKTITKHRHTVIKHMAKCGLLRQGLRHDLSKYTFMEFWTGAKYYAGTQSPNVNERREKGYSVAWLHHKGRNRHHFEYWTDYNPKARAVLPVKMPLKYLVEMFCDRVAASKIYKGKNYTDSSALEYFLSGKEMRQIHPETSAMLEKLLRMLAEKGEAVTFAYIRELLDKGNY